MSACRLILLEKTGRWAAAVRLAHAGRLPPLVETRSWADCSAAVRDWPRSLVAVEVTPGNLGAAVDWIVSAARSFPACRLVCLTTPELSPAELLLREAGAIDVIRSVLETPRLARLARRHDVRAPRQAQSLEEFVAERMPWPALTTA
jgi:hypothetical protein